MKLFCRGQNKPGTTCIVNIDDCSSNPCENNGMCNDLVKNFFKFFCTCLPGYTGKNCTINIDDCDLNPCENNETCSNLKGNFTCECTVYAWIYW